MRIADLLSQKRVSALPAVTGKHELFLKLAALFGQNGGGIGAGSALRSLLERERLGSTGVGGGVALPHGRVPGLALPLGAFVRLGAGMDYEAIDRQPVRLVFALLVPREATDQHLQILAELARLFHDRLLREKLLRAKTVQELYNHLTEKHAA